MEDQSREMQQIEKILLAEVELTAKEIVTLKERAVPIPQLEMELTLHQQINLLTINSSSQFKGDLTWGITAAKYKVRCHLVIQHLNLIQLWRQDLIIIC